MQQQQQQQQQGQNGIYPVHQVHVTRNLMTNNYAAPTAKPPSTNGLEQCKHAAGTNNDRTAMKATTATNWANRNWKLNDRQFKLTRIHSTGKQHQQLFIVFIYLIYRNGWKSMQLIEGNAWTIFGFVAFFVCLSFGILTRKVIFACGGTCEKLRIDWIETRRT